MERFFDNTKREPKDHTYHPKGLLTTISPNLSINIMKWIVNIHNFCTLYKHYARLTVKHSMLKHIMEMEPYYEILCKPTIEAILYKLGKGLSDYG